VHGVVDGQQLGVDDGAQHQLLVTPGDGGEVGEPQRRQREDADGGGERGAGGDGDRLGGGDGHRGPPDRDR